MILRVLITAPNRRSQFANPVRAPLSGNLFGVSNISLGGLRSGRLCPEHFQLQPECGNKHEVRIRIGSFLITLRCRCRWVEMTQDSSSFMQFNRPGFCAMRSVLSGVGIVVSGWGMNTLLPQIWWISRTRENMRTWQNQLDKMYPNSEFHPHRQPCSWLGHLVQGTKHRQKQQFDLKVWPPARIYEVDSKKFVQTCWCAA